MNWAGGQLPSHFIQLNKAAETKLYSARFGFQERAPSEQKGNREQSVPRAIKSLLVKSRTFLVRSTAVWLSIVVWSGGRRRLWWPIGGFMFGFAGGIVGSVIGQNIDQFVQRLI